MKGLGPCGGPREGGAFLYKACTRQVAGGEAARAACAADHVAAADTLKAATAAKVDAQVASLGEYSSDRAHAHTDVNPSPKARFRGTQNPET